MKISILTPDLSHNCLGRAYLLAKILQRHYEVEIIGPIFGDGIWKPVADDNSIAYKSVKICGRFKPYWQIKELAKEIDGDIIYASKPLFTSFGLGLFKRLLNHRPLILDIDDWELGFAKENYRNSSLLSRLESLVISTLFSYNIGSYWNRLISEKFVFFADSITVSNSYLKSKFNGTIVCHGRDTQIFDPKRFNKNMLREKYKIDENKKVVMFLGTPGTHKGIEDLIKAIEIIKDRNIVLIIVGIDNKDNYCISIVNTARTRLGEERFKGYELQLFEIVPEFLVIADLVVIPQRKNFASVGQVPAKVFDAMAMAKPIIATNVSDLPEILDGCGWIVEPENPEQLAETIQYVLNNSQEADIIGQKARQKCIEKYSWDVMDKILMRVFGKYKGI